MPGGRLVRMDCSSACRSLRLFELRATFFAGPEAWPTGNGICPLPQKMGAVRAGSHLRILTVIHSVTCGSLLSLDVSGVRGWHDWQVESRVGSSPLHRAEVLVAPEHKPDDSTPARYGGRASLVFYLIYLRKRNTTVLDAAHRAVFCCPATSLGRHRTAQLSGPGYGRAVPPGSPETQ